LSLVDWVGFRSHLIWLWLGWPWFSFDLVALRFVSADIVAQRAHGYTWVGMGRRGPPHCGGGPPRHVPHGIFIVIIE
jgi:hypothetical protein